MKIKICGLSRDEDIAYVNKVKPDYIGFVFAKSKRQVSFKQAQKLKQNLDKDIQAVGVFVDEKIDVIEELVKAQIIDMVQLHGHEDQDDIDQLRTKIHCPLIKAIRIQSSQDLQHYENIDYYLLDGAQPGSGQVFDWQCIQNLDKPFFLAGGISLDNIEEALKMPCWGIDVSSGVETEGVKDQKKIEELVRRVRNGCR